MSKKLPFIFHVTETRHFEFEVWATDGSYAMIEGAEIWRDAATVAQWELPDQETDYSVSEKARAEPTKGCEP